MRSMDGQTDGKQLIDRIGYLASLVSDPRSVDPILDKLRILTATSSQLSSKDMETLESIRAELENYLIHKEKVRSFTKESLGENVERHFTADNPVRDIKRAALGQVVITIGVASLVTAILGVTGIIKGQVVMAFLIFALFAGLALIFQSIKKDLVKQLRGSVSYLMAATVGTGIFALHFPLIAANSYLESHPMLQHGGFLIAAAPVYACYYIAFYLYAKQLNVSLPRALRPSGVVASVIIVAVLSALVPHPVAVSREIFFDMAVVGFAVSVYFSAIAAILGFRTIPKTTAVYSKTTLFLAISMVLQTIGNGFLLVFVTFMSGDFPVNEERGQILTGVFIITALIFQYIAAYKSKTALT